MRKFILIPIIGLAAVTAQAEMMITEWAYAAGTGEYVELTNLGAAAIDMAGYSYDDDSRTPGVVDLSAFGVVQPGQSVILAEGVAGDFRTAWNLSPAIAIIGGNTTNLGRNDEINIFSGGALIDRLTFGDQNIPGSIRTQNVSGNPGSPAWVGTNDVAQWVLSADGDSFGSYFSTLGDIGNPGTYVPEPTSLLLLAVGGLAAARRR